MPDTWEYRDELALLAKRVAEQQRQLDELATALAAHQRAVERVAEYQGVKHLLNPQ